MTDVTAATLDVLERLKAAGLMVATAESCTGGMILAALTDIAGSSAVVERGFVTYSNEAKIEMLAVPEQLIATYGAVSEPVARAMADGALAQSHADIAVSVTGIAGPGGGSDDKPVGTVHFGHARRGEVTRHSHQLFANMDRAAVRQASVLYALSMIAQGLQD